VLLDCGTAFAAEFSAAVSNPYLNTLRKVSGVPSGDQITAAGGCN
jgi:hypothetical protein